MDLFERFNSKFGKWYEGLFGGEAAELRPKDVLRKIIAAMEDGRKEGLDGKVYVPNKYVLELAVDDPEERDYLLSFLDEEELVSVLKRFMAQNRYHTRGPLDFTIAEVPDAERDARREKLRVRVRFEKGAPEPSAAARPSSPPSPVPGAFAPVPLPKAEGRRAGEEGPSRVWPGRGPAADDLPTVAGADLDDEPGTVPAVAWAALAVTAPDGRKSHFSLTKPMVSIGRSRNAGNDLVLDSDGMVSKTHARIEREPDGRFTLYDLGSTNGVKVNGIRVRDNRVLCDGDEIVIGATRLAFQQAEELVPPPAGAGTADLPRRARLVAQDGEPHVLASETLIGRAVTADIVLDDPSVSTKHARIVAPDPATYYLEDLGSERGTRVNGRPIPAYQRTLLADGDHLTFGAVEVRFEADARREAGP